MITAHLMGSSRRESLLDELDGIFILSRGSRLTKEEIHELSEITDDELEHYVTQCRRAEELV
jgi:hypothetical protein